MTNHFLKATLIALLTTAAAAQTAPTTAPEFLYATGFSSAVYGYRIAPNGALSPVPGTAFGTQGGRPLALGATSDGKFLYVAEYDTDLIEGFAISPRGRLRSLGAIPSGTNPASVALTPSGKFLYVGNEAYNISAYKVHTQNGAISEIPGSPFPANYSSFQLIVDPTGRFLFAGSYDTASAFSIDQATGALTLIDSVAAGSSETWIALDKTSKFLYAASNAGTGDFYGYGINSTNGSLTLLPGFPFYTGVSQREAASVVQNGFIYIAQNYNGGEVAGYTSDTTTGALTPIPGSPFTAGQTAYAVAIDPSGRFVYSADYSANSLIGFSVNQSTGALTPLTVSESIYAPWAIISVTQK
jgi:6-phosphogluconolactonase (cycloisomerase 2 family)